MLNGKFYMGLPPKMIDRNNAVAKNRMESHFYWPDDTDTESAVETRVRRRASLNISAAADRPFVQKRQSSTDGTDNVDTKQMLRKEFTKSSIQFFDNISEEGDGCGEQQKPRRQPLLRASQSREITCKPTATRVELPHTDIDTAAIKKKHTYESKVQFYDYTDDEASKPNNMRLLDRNDKNEMERYTKNSPKLQNKTNVNKYFEQNSRSKSVEPERVEMEQKEREEEEEDEERQQQQRLRKSRGKSVEARNRQNKYRRDQTPKRILKATTIRNGVDYSGYEECRDEHLFNEAADYMDEALKHMQINGRRPARKRVTYSEEEEEIPVRHYKDYSEEADELYCRKSVNQSKNNTKQNRNN